MRGLLGLFALLAVLLFSSCKVTEWHNEDGRVSTTRPEMNDVGTVNATYTITKPNGNEVVVPARNMGAWEEVSYIPWPSYVDDGFLRTLVTLPYNILETPFVLIAKLW